MKKLILIEGTWYSSQNAIDKANEILRETNGRVVTIVENESKTKIYLEIHCSSEEDKIKYKVKYSV